MENAFISTYARAYTAKLEAEDRKTLEDLFMHNGVKCLVATVALGMGYDKADIGFVIHYQRPGNVVSYYQQIGRAGRKLDNAFAILLNVIEDDDIQEYFIKTAFPTETEMNDIVSVIEKSIDGLKQNQILRAVNIRLNRLEKCIKFLEVENIISKDKDGKYFRTVNPWAPDIGKSETVTKRRYEELEEMKQFVELNTCYMQFIAQKLDDPYAIECGKCSICVGEEFFSTDVNPEFTLKAIKFLKGEHIEIERRKQWPAGIMAETQKKIRPEDQVEDGRALCAFGDAGWGRFIHDDKYVNNYFKEELVDASVVLILKWMPDKIANMCITYIPSLSKPELVKSFAHRVAKKLNIPCLDIIEKTRRTWPQKELEYSAYQCQNAFEGFAVTGDCPNRDIILIDDMVEPSALFDVSSESVKRKLNLSDDEVARIERLLSRSGQFGIELSALNDNGIFTLTRFDKEYPASFKNKLKKLAPPILYYAGNLSLLNNKGISIVGSRDIDEAALKFTEQLSRRCTNDGLKCHKETLTF